MSTFNRLLSRREKNSHHHHHHHHHGHQQPKGQTSPLNGIFVDDEKPKKPEKDEDVKVKAIQQKLAKQGIKNFRDSDIYYVLSTQYAKGDIDKSYELLVLLEDSDEGIVNPYNLEVKLLGAVNREGVTCYLDALLFAMFARLGSFEAMLYKNFEDEPRKRLATLLRLWVNTLRAGKLITVDITKQIQLQIANCGWKEAAKLCQHDASEAFTFITETLALPLLTLKMDIFHTGKPDTKDDHKFINERLLDLAIPEEPKDGHTITLEECLEMFFNNKIEVKRYLDLMERRNTLSSIRSRTSVGSTKGNTSHVEVAECDDSQPSSPMPLQSLSNPFSASPDRPMVQRRRAPSIIQNSYINEKAGYPHPEEDGSHPRTRKEVMMPAWQFFSLIPWYTDNKPTTDAQVAAHFSTTRPILGICLKRYGIHPNGTAFKRRTHIDIPLEIGLPHFISDDAMSDDGPAFGNFKLSLQSVVCHQGVSVEAGHYISFVRSPDPDGGGEDQWMRFDDLANERVVNISIEDSLKRESPYLLFYQVIPIEGEASILDGKSLVNQDPPPSYADSNVSKGSKAEPSFTSDVSTGVSTSEESAAQRPSIDTSISEEGKRGRSSMTSDRRQSVIFSDETNSSLPHSAPAIDIAMTHEFSPNSAVSSRADLRVLNDVPNVLTTSRQGSKTRKGNSRSRPSSQSGESRLSTSLSRLANRMSRDRLNTLPLAAEKPVEESRSRNSLTLDDDRAGERVRLKKEVRGKSKTVAKEHHLLSKGKKPDRECTVM